MDARYFSDKIVEWYELNKRNLPWRSTKDPYQIWLSEIILQQTRVNQGLPYFLRFIEKFPTVRQLAYASEDEILRLWQGLGYYTRARNLHKCAKAIDEQFHGAFPDRFDELKKLPGIGEYTAAAIASISFNERVAVVDGNVFRVLARIFGIAKEINSNEGKRYFFELANKLITNKRSDLHNQAMMEFGALQCTPKNPSCSTCIFQSVCWAAQNNAQDQLPVKLKAKPQRKRYFYYLVFKKGNKLLMKKREHKDIWHGLYDFYALEKKRSIKTLNILEEASFGKVASYNAVTSPVYKHILTHQIIISKFIIINDPAFVNPDKNLKYYSYQEISQLPKPVLISKFLEDYKFL